MSCVQEFSYVCGRNGRSGWAGWAYAHPYSHSLEAAPPGPLRFSNLAPSQSLGGGVPFSAVQMSKKYTIYIKDILLPTCFTWVFQKPIFLNQRIKLTQEYLEQEYNFQMGKKNPISGNDTHQLHINKITIREHSYMTSDVFWEFLTYLPTLIRYFTT